MDIVVVFNIFAFIKWRYRLLLYWYEYHPDKDNDGIPDSIDPLNNIMNPGVLLLLHKTP